MIQWSSKDYVDIIAPKILDEALSDKKESFIVLQVVELYLILPK